MKRSTKRWIAVLSALACVCITAACVWGILHLHDDSPASEGLAFALNNDGKSYCVNGIGTCTDTDIVIPPTYSGLPVTSIAWSAFHNCSDLTSIAIPDSVTSIGSSSFSDCSSLTSITIPDSVTKIENYAFLGTAYYENEDNWTDGVLYIGNHLIEAKTSLSDTYTIREGTKSIAAFAFHACSSLRSIVIPDSVTRIDDDTFRSCSSLTSITIPDSVTSIGSYAFYGCSSLTSITIPDSVTDIGVETFSDTAYYKNEDNRTDGVLYIGNHLIEANDSLSGAYTIREGTKCIAAAAFSDCSGLTSITIPDSVTNMDYMVLYYCSNLTSIIVSEGNALYHSTGNCLIETASKTLIIGCQSSIIPDDGSVTSIGGSAFWGCSSMTSIVIPESVTSIGGGAFCGCSSLTSITIPDSVTSIGGYAFYYCSSLTDICFTGTIEQWSAIEKGSDWKAYTGSYTIHCSNGDITK